MGIGGKAQTDIHPLLYLGALLAFFPLCIYLPTHLALGRFLPHPTRDVPPGPRSAGEQLGKDD